MSIVVEKEEDIEREGLDVLIKYLPPSKVARLLSLWRIGQGDYVRERRKLFTDETVETLFAKAHTLEKRSRKR
jgi:hypothetical protein